MEVFSMEIRVTDQASEYLRNELSNKSTDKLLRVFVSGLG
jgi:Fe-S cluster assembly iron-binding protein IscA